MGTEIERKFLVVGDAWRSAATSAAHITQGYLSGTSGTTVRVRTRGDRGFLTVKGRTEGFSRAEFEYEIPLADAQAMLGTLAVGPVIDKIRFLVPVGAHMWEVDVFAGANRGLVVAEIELATADASFEHPEWLGAEVSHDPRYFNSALARRPYTTWGSPDTPPDRDEGTSASQAALGGQ